MKYLRNKNTNFSQEEVDFLNNFKTIDEFNNFSVNFAGLMDKLNENPSLYYGLLGGAGGAGIGAGANLIFGNKKKSNLRKLIEGALIGGVLGSGAGAIGGGFLKGDGNSTQGGGSIVVPTQGQQLNQETSAGEQVVDDDGMIIPVGTAIGGALGLKNVHGMTKRNAEIRQNLRNNDTAKKLIRYRKFHRDNPPDYVPEPNADRILHRKQVRKEIGANGSFWRGDPGYTSRKRRVAGALFPVVAGAGVDALGHYLLKDDQ